ncbi:MAG: hypothetical protein SGJ00_10345 [bacterium]|nr:hypothetical protein [bacterium]
MRLILFLLFLFSVVVFSACNRCEGYGYEPSSSRAIYASYLVLTDNTDTIRSLTYDIKPGELLPNKCITPLLISFLSPAYVQVKTDKHAYQFRIQVTTSYTYWYNRNCEVGGSEMVVSQPIIDSISGGKITRKRVSFTDIFGRVIHNVVDSINLAP